MADKNSTTSSGGVGFFGLMFLILMTLKLTNYIDWSWWWVTAPLWIPIVIIGIIGIGAIWFLNRK